VWTGQVGVAERALGLRDSAVDATNLIWRGAYGLSLLAVPYAGWRALYASKGTAERVLWWVVSTASSFVAIFYFGGGAAVYAVTTGVPFASAFATARTGALAGIFAVGGTIGVGMGSFDANAGAIAVAIAFFGAAMFSSFAAQKAPPGRQGAYLLLSFLAVSIAAFLGVWISSTSGIWQSVTGPVLLVFGVLTLVNAPFVWFAVGLTRAFLRRGLAPDGRGPFFYALLDAVVALLVALLLAPVIVLAVQTFDDIAQIRAGVAGRIIEPGPLFRELHGAKYSWVWLMLFSTLIPSMINLCVAAASLIRGLPILNAWVVTKMPDTIRDSDRALVASALASQIVGGVVLTGIGLYLIVVCFLPFWLQILAFAGRIAERLSDLDAPKLVMAWFGIIR
jgi:hypothetical protein